jgi:hypothetical protein
MSNKKPHLLNFAYLSIKKLKESGYKNLFILIVKQKKME